MLVTGIRKTCAEHNDASAVSSSKCEPTWPPKRCLHLSSLLRPNTSHCMLVHPLVLKSSARSHAQPRILAGTGATSFVFCGEIWNQKHTCGDVNRALNINAASSGQKLVDVVVYASHDRIDADHAKNQETNTCGCLRRLRATGSSPLDGCAPGHLHEVPHVENPRGCLHDGDVSPNIVSHTPRSCTAEKALLCMSVIFFLVFFPRVSDSRDSAKKTVSARARFGPSLGLHIIPPRNTAVAWS